MPVTVDRQVEWAGLLLDPPYYLQTVEGLVGLPAVRTADLERVAADGDIAGVDRLGGRTITITLYVSDSNAAAFASAVAALQASLSPRLGARPLVFRIPGVAGGQTARVLARPRRAAGLVDALYHQSAAEIVVEFRAADPRLYGDTELTAQLSPATPSGGHGFNHGFDVGFGGLGNPGIATVTNTGTVPAPVRVRINGPAVDPQIRNEATGEELTLSMTLGAGEWVDLDSSSRTVLLGGTANRYHLLTTAGWWELQPGANELRFSATDPTGATASVSWRDAWL